jgi:hypothetical protein
MAGLVPAIHDVFALQEDDSPRTKVKRRITKGDFPLRILGAFVVKT